MDNFVNTTKNTSEIKLVCVPAMISNSITTITITIKIVFKPGIIDGKISHNKRLMMVNHSLHYEMQLLIINYTIIRPLDLQRIFNFYCFLNIIL